MLILGLGGLGYKDSSAALVKDGRVVAAAGEERFTRVKHQGGYPSRAIEACLRIAGATAAEIDHVAVANNPWLALRSKVLDWYGADFFESPDFRAYHIFHDEIHSTLTYLKALEDLRVGRDGRFHVVPHHLSHLASSFLAGPYAEAAVLDVDGRGEFSTSAQGRGSGASIEVFRVDHMPNSLGLLYAAVSDYLGFTGQDDEFRVMSISSQGEPRFQSQFREIVRLSAEGSFELNSAYFTYREGLAALSSKFIEVFGASRRAGEPVLQRHRDIAASLQRAIEDAVPHAARHLARRTGAKALCFAGGVALNWVVNGRIAAEGVFENFHVNPLAGDDGTAVGAALWVHADVTKSRPEPLGSVALGPASTDAEIEDALRRTRHRYTRVADPFAVAAERLARGEILGWFEGRMEFGPRGLGQRAILADPANLATKGRLLRDVKPREEHHPFGVSLLADRASEVFEGHADSPYMLVWNRVRPERRTELAAVVNPDGVARWHGVSHDREPAFHALLTAFGARGGRLPALVNTSLNLPGRPPPVTPREALEVLATTGLDALVMGPFVVSKQDPAYFAEARRVTSSRAAAAGLLLALSASSYGELVVAASVDDAAEDRDAVAAPTDGAGPPGRTSVVATASARGTSAIDLELAPRRVKGVVAPLLTVHAAPSPGAGPPDFLVWDGGRARGADGDSERPLGSSRLESSPSALSSSGPLNDFDERFASANFARVLERFVPADSAIVGIDAFPTPEPGAIALFALGAAVLVGAAWRARRDERAARRPLTP